MLTFTFRMYIWYTRHSRGWLYSRLHVPRHWCLDINIKLIIWHRSLPEKLTITQLIKKFPSFFGSDGSLPWSQEPVTGPYSEPHKSSLLCVLHTLPVPSSSTDHPINIWWRVQIMKYLIIQFSPASWLPPH